MYTCKVYLKHTSSILEYTSSILEAYFKCTSSIPQPIELKKYTFYEKITAPF